MVKQLLPTHETNKKVVCRVEINTQFSLTGSSMDYLSKIQTGGNLSYDSSLQMIKGKCKCD